MDRKVLIASLNNIFRDFNRKKKKYSEIWLTDDDFGGLYYSGNYILNLKSAEENSTSSYRKKIEEVLSLLDEKAKEELQYISKVKIYNHTDQVAIESEGKLVYEE